MYTRACYAWRPVNSSASPFIFYNTSAGFKRSSFDCFHVVDRPFLFVGAFIFLNFSYRVFPTDASWLFFVISRLASRHNIQSRKLRHFFKVLKAILDDMVLFLLLYNIKAQRLKNGLSNWFPVERNIFGEKIGAILKKDFFAPVDERPDFCSHVFQLMEFFQHLVNLSGGNDRHAFLFGQVIWNTDWFLCYSPIFFFCYTWPHVIPFTWWFTHMWKPMWHWSFTPVYIGRRTLHRQQVPWPSYFFTPFDLAYNFLLWRVKNNLNIDNSKCPT